MGVRVYRTEMGDFTYLSATGLEAVFHPGSSSNSIEKKCNARPGM
jgi:hypothetical protein